MIFQCSGSRAIRNFKLQNTAKLAWVKWIKDEHFKRIIKKKSLNSGVSLMSIGLLSSKWELIQYLVMNFYNEWTVSDVHFDNLSKMTKSVFFFSFFIPNVQKSVFVEVKACKKYDCFGFIHPWLSYWHGRIVQKSRNPFTKRKISLKL